MISGKTYILENVVVDNFTPPDSWYQKYPWVNRDTFWMSLPYEEGRALVQYIRYETGKECM